MPTLFEPVRIGDLNLRNRIMRSATAERMAHPETGHPSSQVREMYTDLAQGGIGLIVTGHAYVDHSGRAHPEMSSISTDDVIPVWQEIIQPAQEMGARVMMQINHSGGNCEPSVTPWPLSPSGVAVNELATPRQMTNEEIQHLILAFGQAARRVREAGFDGVQVHGAHGYLVSQFLTPLTNQRDDNWGGDTERRCTFLKAIIHEIRRQVGNDYPVWIKLGVAGSEESGLAVDEGTRIAALCAGMEIDCIEISHALGEPKNIDKKQEAPFRPWAEAVRESVGNNFSLALVNGNKTYAGMETLLESGLVQMVSLCRPLIAEPDLANKLHADPNYKHACGRCWECWPKELGTGVACRNAAVLRRLEQAVE
jgi:2,4-dienoyl-CoA reductase-like NADH-dependent reductase (Old Yellow Enzyme family)